MYRIQPDGVWDQVWESRDDSPYDVTFDQDGAPIIATGNKGKLYRLEGDPLRPTLLTRAQRAAGDRVLERCPRPAVLRDRQSRKVVPAVVRARALAARTNPSRTMRRWSRRGEPCAGAARFRKAARSSCPRGAATPRRRTRRGARGRRLRLAGWFADHQPEGALPPVARGADRQRATVRSSRRSPPRISSATCARSCARSPCTLRASCFRSRSRQANRISPVSAIRRRPIAS